MVEFMTGCDGRSEGLLTHLVQRAGNLPDGETQSWHWTGIVGVSQAKAGWMGKGLSRL